MKHLKYILLSLLLIVAGSCKDDNKGFDEYYNSMGNNPAMVIPWMKDLVKDLRKTQAIIQAYEYNGKTYYTSQTYVIKGNTSMSSYTIYEDNEKKEIVFYHSDNILIPEANEDSIYLDFKTYATFLYLIWKNTPNDGTAVEF